jgi:hypothetical protein
MGFVIAFISGAITYRVLKNFLRKRTKAQPKNTKLQKETDELITTILPIVFNKK